MLFLKLFFNSYFRWIILYTVLELLENESRRTAQAWWGWGWTYGDSRKRAKENFEYDSAGRNWAKAPPPAGLAPPFLKSSLSSALQWRKLRIMRCAQNTLNFLYPQLFEIFQTSTSMQLTNHNHNVPKVASKFLRKLKIVKKDLIGHSLKLFVNVSLSSHKHNPSGINFDILGNR